MELMLRVRYVHSLLLPVVSLADLVDGDHGATVFGYDLDGRCAAYCFDLSSGDRPYQTLPSTGLILSGIPRQRRFNRRALASLACSVSTRYFICHSRKRLRRCSRSLEDYRIQLCRSYSAVRPVFQLPMDYRVDRLAFHCALYRCWES